MWCVEQLEVGISNSKKPDSKQSQEAMKLLKVLRNPTAPLIKKRQVMRNAFGDYRKKMEQEEKKYRMSEWLKTWSGHLSPLLIKLIRTLDRPYSVLFVKWSKCGINVCNFCRFGECFQCISFPSVISADKRDGSCKILPWYFSVPTHPYLKYKMNEWLKSWLHYCLPII